MAYPKQLTKAQFRRHEHLARADDVHEHIMHVEEGWAAQYVENA